MKLSLLFILLLPVYFCYGQDDLPQFGDVDYKDIALKQCDFDKDADAVTLFHVASSSYDNQYRLITSHRIRFKILKEKGIERANIEIPFYGEDALEKISQIEAMSYTIESNGETIVKQLDKKSVFQQKVNQFYSIVKFSIPNVKVRTIIEYKYTIVSDNYGFLKDWYFQSDMPVILSRYALSIVPTREFSYVVHKAPDIPIKINSNKTLGSIIFQMDNIAGLRYEPYMDAIKDYLQYVEFQQSGYRGAFGGIVKFMTTWKEAAQELMSDFSFGKQIDKDLPNSGDIVAKANAFSAPYDKMNFIYNYVRDNFSWNRIYSLRASDGIKNAWANKNGSSGEINLILINLLKHTNIEVYPILVSEREHGKVNPNISMLDQFNKVAAYAAIADVKFVLDATSVNMPANLIPFDLLNTNAFIVNTKKPDVIKLGGNVRGASNFIIVNSNISSDGIVSGYTIVSSSDYAKIKRLEDYRKNRENFRRDYFEKDYPEIKIDSFEIRNSEIDTGALEQQFNFAMPAETSGDYKLVNVNLFSGIEKNPFTLDNRFTDIDFGCTHSTTLSESFELPSNFKPEEIPKNVQILMPDKSISFIRKAELNQNTIRIEMSLKINETIYPAAMYPLLKEFYKKMYNILNEKIVLSKK